MEAQTFLSRIKNHEFFEDQIVHIEKIAERKAIFGEVDGGLHDLVAKAIEGQGIDRLYRHQAEAINAIRKGEDVVIVTGTASGKTLCYTVPVIESILADSMATALFLFPTKALTQDQLKGLGKFQDKKGGIHFLAGTYDGDTPQNLRRKLRDDANIILTNPDMLHQAILPQHARWNRFFTHLKFVVIDEVHAYRGIFGSHLANVIRRLDRICRHYGARPQFVCCSATIANPDEHAGRLAGRTMRLINTDGAPRGPKQFVLWNPPPIQTAARGGRPDNWRVGGDRRSSLWESVNLMTLLVKESVQTIAFVRTRLSAELIYKHAHDLLEPVSRKLAGALCAYRGGYLPEERREIERKLNTREILGVASTNALELGIDIGSLDACILVGYPGSVASLWQQAGRAGRGHDEAIIFLVGQNSPMDQYLMVHSDYLFAQSPEQAVVDPDNPHVIVGHLKCAVNELPLDAAQADLFGQYAPAILELLEEEGALKKIDGKWYWASMAYPAAEVNLRNIAGPVYTIQDESEGSKVIGTIDEISALAQLHTHAVYLHGAQTYFVNKLDTEQKIAQVEKRDLDYYTRSVQMSKIRIDDTAEEGAWRECLSCFGDVTVTTSIPMFKKIKFHSRDSLGYEKLELPPQELETVSLWLSPPQGIIDEMSSRKMIAGEALIGMANVLVDVAPFYVMCDAQDIGTVVDNSCLGREALFVHDRYPGGMGYARRCRDALEELMQTIYTVIKECGCEDGCPSCVGSAIPAFAMGDIDAGVRGRIPDKAAALFMLERILGK
jgi:DEAD/DEAH box helicase domain-containing protein